MSRHETSLGGEGEVFPNTPWSRALSIPEADSSERREILKKLCTLYWRPVYVYIRASWRKTIEDAKDLTQGFFEHLMKVDLISGYQAEKGRFRHFLRAALKHYLLNVKRDSLRLKRGGGITHLSLHVEGMEAAGLAADIERHSPEELYDRQWARDVLSETLGRLRRTLTDEGRESHLKAYEAHELYPKGSARPTYREIAESLDCTVDEVKHKLMHARATFRHLLMEVIRDCVTSREDLEKEIDRLFSD